LRSELDEIRYKGQDYKFKYESVRASIKGQRDTYRMARRKMRERIRNLTKIHGTIFMDPDASVTIYTKSIKKKIQIVNGVIMTSKTTVFNTKNQK
jgi:hypothetical protein